MAISEASRQQNSFAIAHAEMILPEGEIIQGILTGMEEYSGVEKFLRSYVFGWLVNLILGYPKIYTVLYTDKSLVLVQVDSRTGKSIEEKGCAVLPLSDLSMKSSFGKFILQTPTIAVHLMSHQAASDAKQEFEALSQKMGSTTTA